MYPSLSQRLRSQHDSVAELISGRDEKFLNSSLKSGKWSVKDNIAHLACYQPLFLERLNRILKEDEPSFQRYNAGDDPAFPSWQAKTTHELLNSLRTEREKIVNFCTQLDQPSLQRCGLHVKYGKLTIVNWLEFFILHEAHHLFTIFQLVHEQENLNPEKK